MHDLTEVKTDAGKQVRQVGAPVAKHGRRQEMAFAAATAAISGQSVRSIQRDLARAEAIGDDLPRVHGTSLDKGTELDALAKLPEAERKALIGRAAAGEKVSAVKALKADKDDEFFLVNLKAKTLTEMHRKLSNALAVIEMHMQDEKPRM